MSTVGLFQHFHHKDSVLWDGKAQEVQEMNSIELDAFCSDFPKDWVKNQQRQKKKKKSTPHWPAREVCKSQRSPSFAWAEYILVYHALNMWKPGRAVRCFSLGPKGFKGFSVSKWGFEVEHWGGGSEEGWEQAHRSVRPLCYFRLLISSCKANKNPWCSELPQVIFMDRRG